MKINHAMLNGKYAALQGSYWIAYCVLGSFAALFLLQNDFTDFEIGIILAAGNVLAVFLQFVFASLEESVKWFSASAIVTTSTGMLLAASVALCLFSENRKMIAVLIVAGLAILVMLQPFINSLSFIRRPDGGTINFGFARGIGSLSYAVASVAIGKAIKVQGTPLVPVLFAVSSGAVFFYALIFRGKGSMNYAPRLELEECPGEPLCFSRTHAKFVLFSASVFLIFFDHSLIGNFFVRIIMNVHGDTAQMGNCLGLAAVLELPVMAGFWFFRERIQCATALKISGIMFLLKHLLTFCAHSVGMLYIAQVFQIGAFALFLPAATYYAEKTLSPRDLVKGQTFIMGAITLSGVIASMVGGFTLERYGVPSTLFIGLCVSVVGTAVLFVSLVPAQSFRPKRRESIRK